MSYDTTSILSLIELRNQIIILQKRLLKKPEKTLADIFTSSDIPEKLPPFLKNGFQILQRAFSEIPLLNKKYYARFLSFILNEQRYTRVGTSCLSQLTSIRRKNTEEKQQAFSLLWDITWNKQKSLPDKALFVFNISVYHLQKNPTCKFVMEHFPYDQYQSLIRSLSWFLLAPQERQDLLLGLPSGDGMPHEDPQRLLQVIGTETLPVLLIQEILLVEGQQVAQKHPFVEGIVLILQVGDPVVLAIAVVVEVG
ncbi:MAG: hypothetical protein ACUVRN_06690, partial [Candidatus Caldatribacteriaceae bacterium]